MNAADKMKEILARAPGWLHLYNRKYQTRAIVRMNDLLEKSGMSQKELAARAGWKEGYVSRILSGGENITLKTLARFEDAIGAEVLAVTTDAVEETRGARVLFTHNVKAVSGPECPPSCPHAIQINSYRQVGVVTSRVSVTPLEDLFHVN